MRFKTFYDTVVAAADPENPSAFKAAGVRNVILVTDAGDLHVENVVVTDEGDLQIIAKPLPEFKDHKDDSAETWYREAGLTKAQIASLVPTDA